MKFRQLRKLSFREACEEIWMGYRALIASGLNRVEFLFKRTFSLPLWLRAIITIVGVAFIAGVIATPWLFKTAKAYRSEHMLVQAKELQADGRNVEAYQKIRAAALLRPDQAEVRELVLELAEEVRSPQAVWWAERAAKANNYDAESIAKVIEMAAYFRQSQIGVRYLAMLQEAYPDYEGATDAELRLLLSQGKRVEAINKALHAYKNGETSPTIHEVLAMHYLNASDPIAQKTLADYLQENLNRNDEVGLSLKRLVLTRTAELSPEVMEQVNFAQILTDLRQFPEAKQNDRALAIGRALEHGDISKDEAQATILAEFDINDPDEREDLMEMASIFGLYGIIESLPATQKRELNQLRLEGMVLSETPDFEGARQLLDSSSEATLAPLQASFWNAMLAREQGHNEAFTKSLIEALNYATLEEWVYLERILHRRATEAQLLEFYRESVQRLPNTPYIAAHALNYAYQVGADAELAAMAQQMPLDTFKRDPYSQIFLIYLKALQERDLSTSRYHAEDLVAKYPREASYYIALAFVYAQSQNVPLAKSVISSFPLGNDYEAMPPFLRICLAATGNTAALPDIDKLPLAKEREIAKRLVDSKPTEAALN
ncbi:hypothetical protein GCM10007047_26170 [Cerasicoccus arenae]|uniref:Uncharacterized protein n=2 Tax=Cerasicoccus arenae TaxID=424488 RepID=A0A8J3DHG6_9BACT|nr:hypothetical protein GCM10007047_26170 [Cerasicoccus arenae]